ncbi:MAG: hypothetical protein K2G62_02565, partial [Oscillospiraceae bacterium]|nr:hypothetical protein [Oscillospiraceae bacterium]
MSLYCSLISTNCEEMDCSNASELFNEFECACLSPDELQYLKDRINQNSDAISKWKVYQFEQTSSIYEDLSTRFNWLQSQIDKNHIRISDTNNRIDKFGFELSSAIKDLALLEKYSKDFLKGIIDKHTSHINDLHKNVSINASDILKLGIKGDGLSKLIQMMNSNVNNNTAAINKILASLFSQGIFVEGFVDEDDLPDFGVADEGPCPDCANKGDTNIFLGDNYFKGKLELINRDFVIRHPFPKGTKPEKESHLDVIWRDNEGSVTSDNMSSVASMVEPNGDIKTALRSYRNVSGSIEHCDIILTTPQKGESYVELSNLKIGTQYNEYQCGTGWLETWDWIHGHTTLEIDKSVNLNTKGGDTHIHESLTVDKNTHLNVDGGTTIIEGDTHIHNTFEVDGDSHFHSNIHVDKNTYVQGWIKAEGTVEGNITAGISGGGAKLMELIGYDCMRQGPFPIMRVHNGIYATLSAVYKVQVCATADLAGGLVIHTLNKKPGALSVQGYVDVRDHLCIGMDWGRELEQDPNKPVITTPKPSDWTKDHMAAVIYGGVVIHPRSGNDSDIGKPKDQFDGCLQISGFVINGNYCIFDGGTLVVGADKTDDYQSVSGPQG